jgi:hypothetical protein
MVADPDSVADQITCHIKDCAQQAVYFCERCGHTYCAEHIRHISIERRQSQSHLGGSERLPTQTETYMLCPSCWNKPVPGKLPQPIP